MKEKIITFIFVSIFMVTIYQTNEVLAGETLPVTSYGFYVVDSSGFYGLYLYGFNIIEVTDYNANAVRVKYAVLFNNGTYYRTLEEAISAGYSIGRSYVDNGQRYLLDYYYFSKNMQTDPSKLYVYNMPGSENTENEEEDTNSWIKNAWDTFVDYFTNPVPFQWFKNLIDRVFDDDDETTISDGVSLTNPTLTPAPTPIPFSTVVIPKTDINTGETYYETNYIYANPSGTPIVQPYPPTNQPSGNAGGSGDSYYPVDGEPLKLPKLKWLSPVTIGDSNYDGIDSIYDGLSSVDDIGSEYTDGISAVSDATSVLPTNWLMLIGIAAAIPLLAGIISRFLS